ncbi:hypothetical protein SDJN03_02415, partial [Cucurbita argyrosperma subsp. sororia]
GSAAAGKICPLGGGGAHGGCAVVVVVVVVVAECISRSGGVNDLLKEVTINHPLQQEDVPPSAKIIIDVVVFLILSSPSQHEFHSRRSFAAAASRADHSVLHPDSSPDGTSLSMISAGLLGVVEGMVDVLTGVRCSSWLTPMDPSFLRASVRIVILAGLPFSSDSGCFSLHRSYQPL